VCRIAGYVPSRSDLCTGGWIIEFGLSDGRAPFCPPLIKTEATRKSVALVADSCECMLLVGVVVGV